MTDFLYPQDRVALAAYLRSPLVGMSDNGLVRVLSSGDGLSAGIDGLTESDAKRLSLAVERHAELSELADTVTLTDLIHHIWYRWGYRYHLLRRDAYSAYLEHFDYIYELARLYEDRGLAAFLSSVRSGIGRNERTDELNVVRDESDGVHIMTIHKAKGLEFPVVIVANTGNRGRTDSISSAPFYRSAGHGLVFNVAAGDPGSPREQPVNFIYRHERDEALLQDEAELRRLLYVAATRAETHLVFSGYHRANDASLLTMILGPFEEAVRELAGAPDLSIASRMLDPVPADAILRVRTGAGNRDIAAIADRYADGDRLVVERSFPRRDFTPTELNTLWLEAASGADGSASATSVNPARADGGPDLFIDTAAGAGLADCFGTFAHYCVERMGSGHAAARDLANPAALPETVRPPLSGRRLERFLTEGTQLAERFLGSEFWSEHASAAGVEFEVPFLLSLSDSSDNGPTEADGSGSSRVRVRGKMDLVIDLPDRVLVVDFKTDRILHPAHYAVQMELYRRAAAAIFAKPVEVVLIHLRTATPVPAAEPVDDISLARLIRAARESRS